MATEKLDVLIVGKTPAALRCESKAKELGLLVRRLDGVSDVLPSAYFLVEATNDGSLGLSRRVFTRNDFELRSETGERMAPTAPVAETTPRRILGDIILSANDLEAKVSFPDATTAGGIPLRSLYSCWSGNLFMAGATISTTAQAQKMLMARPEVLEKTGEVVAIAIAVARRNKETYHRTVYGNHWEEVRRMGGALELEQRGK